MANTKHAVVRLDRMSGTTDGSKLRSAKYFSGSEVAAIDNGNIVKITSELLDREVFKVTAPTATDTKATIGLVASVEIIYDSPLVHTNLDEFENRANSVIRVYLLETGDVYSVTAEGISGTPEKGKYLGITADSTKLTVADDTTSAIAEIIDVETTGGYKYFVVKVL